MDDDNLSVEEVFDKIKNNINNINNVVDRLEILIYGDKNE